MTNYHVELPGKFTLAQLSKAIEGEEALGTRFIASRIWVNSANVLTNLAEFEELDTAPEPPLGSPRLAKELPTGATATWAGPMIVAGAAIAQVFLLRV